MSVKIVAIAAAAMGCLYVEVADEAATSHLGKMYDCYELYTHNNSHEVCAVDVQQALDLYCGASGCYGFFGYCNGREISRCVVQQECQP